MATDDLGEQSGKTKRGSGSGPGNMPSSKTKYYVLAAFILVGLAAAYFSQ